MTRTEIDATLAAANPLTDQTAAALELHDAEAELIERIAATSVRPRPLRPAPWRSRVMPRRRRVTLVVTATAMPPSVVKTADSGETIRLMLKGIPLPPGFDAARIRGARLVHDRYQLGAAVSGTVACMWIADWSRARADGDTAMVRRAIAAMASAPRWPILRQMARSGAWPQVLIGYAQAMPRGTWYGRPLTADVNSGLGCGPQWGVSLER
jgi:hypothetical protein